MTNSMTGYAVRDGQADAWRWTWEIRAVNGRGLDIRLRLPDWPGDMEPAVRAAVQEAAARGNVTVGLRLTRASGAGSGTINLPALDAAIGMARQVETHAATTGLALRPATPVDFLTLRGVVDQDAVDEDPSALRDAMLADLSPLMAAFSEMRADEGAKLEDILRGHVATIERIVSEARDLAGPRSEKLAEGFREALDRIVGQAATVDESRIAQEIAALSVKADVTEELDRLDAHVAAARALLDADGPKGRKLDFLTQEFNREANTLCAKSGFAQLTALGLDLKHTVDQMREQVQNVE